MMFEETVPAGTKSTFHLHHDSDEVVYVCEKAPNRDPTRWTDQQPDSWIGEGSRSAPVVTLESCLFSP
jgi:hypothetical protein